MNRISFQRPLLRTLIRVRKRPSWSAYCSRLATDDLSFQLHVAFSSSPPEENDKEQRNYKIPVTSLWEQMKSLPNLITAGRLASTPILSFLIVTHQHQAALVGCLLAAFSDGLDGYIAKHYDMATVLGTYLDPFADKILINTLSLSIWYSSSSLLPTPLVGLWFVKDVALMGATYQHVLIKAWRKAGNDHHVLLPLQVNPTFTSKVNTALQFVTLGTALVHPLLDGTTGVDSVMQALCWLTGATTVASAFSYVGYSAFTENDANESARTEEDGSTSNAKTTCSSSKL